MQNPVAQVVVAILWSHGPFATPGQGGCSLGMHGSPPKRRDKKARRSAAGRPSRRFGPPRRSWGLTRGLTCQEPSETGTLSPSTLVRNAPLSVQNRTNLPDTLNCAKVSDALNVCGLGPVSLRELFDTLRVIGPSEMKAKMEGASRSEGANGYAGSVATQLADLFICHRRDHLPGGGVVAMEEAQPSPSTRVEISRHSCCVGSQRTSVLPLISFSNIDKGCLRGKGDVPASAGPDQRVRTSNPRLEFDCRHGFGVRVTPPRQLGCTPARLRTAWAKPRAPRSGS